MSSKVKFELNLPGLNELMKSGEMQSHLEAAGQAVASAAGNDYGTRVHQASYVAIANVFPASKEAAVENYKENTLLKALGSAGLSINEIALASTDTLAKNVIAGKYGTGDVRKVVLGNRYAEVQKRVNELV